MATEENTLIQILQQGFRVTVGATTALVEALQNPDKRSETLSELQNQWHQKSQEWSAKGETTEQEARRIVEEWLTRQRSPTTTTTIEVSDLDHQSTTSDSSPQTDVQAEIQDLTQQLTALRTEIEKLRQSKS